MVRALAVRGKRRRSRKYSLEDLEPIGDLEVRRRDSVRSEGTDGGAGVDTTKQFSGSETLLLSPEHEQSIRFADVKTEGDAADDDTGNSEAEIARLGGGRRRMSSSSRSQIMHKYRRETLTSLMLEEQPKACIFLDMDNWFRRLCLNLMCHPNFDRAVLLLIIANSICLAIEDPLATSTNPLLENLEVIFNIIFTIEMLIKMVAMGVRGSKHGYLTDGWNRMDAIVVFMGWLPYVLKIFMSEGGDSANFTAIRVVRILKVLKTIQRVEGVRKLVRVAFCSSQSVAALPPLRVLILIQLVRRRRYYYLYFL